MKHFELEKFDTSNTSKILGVDAKDFTEACIIARKMSTPKVCEGYHVPTPYKVVAYDDKKNYCAYRNGEFLAGNV